MHDPVNALLQRHIAQVDQQQHLQCYHNEAGDFQSFFHIEYCS